MEKQVSWKQTGFGKNEGSWKQKKRIEKKKDGKKGI